MIQLDRSRVLNVCGIVLFIVISIALHLVKDTLIKSLGGLPGYLAIFLISFLGAMSILIPIPYVAIIFTLATTGGLDPILTALSGGAGSGLGEFTGWMLGRLFSGAIESTKYFNRIQTLIKFLEKKGRIWIPILILIFALTPLPDDVLFIVLGVLRYSLWKALAASICGKVLMMYIVAYSGITIGSYLERSGVSSDVVFMGSIIALTIIVAAMMFIDWEKILGERLSLDVNSGSSQDF